MIAQHVQHSTLHSHSHAGYVAWVYENHKYKNSIIQKLSIQNANNITAFITLFNISKDIGVYIVTKRLWRLFRLPSEIIVKYNTKELHQVDMLLEFVSYELLVPVVLKCNLDKITKYNIHDVIRYFNDYDRFMNDDVEWGPGNHNDIDANITEHYIKHVLSNEGRHWKSLLSDMSEQSYKDYARNMFKRMERVVVHSNGRHTYMSGFYGKIFIVGRYHEGVFGISSCYYVNDGEKPGRYIDACVNIHN